LSLFRVVCIKLQADEFKVSRVGQNRLKGRSRFPYQQVRTTKFTGSFPQLAKDLCLLFFICTGRVSEWLFTQTGSNFQGENKCGTC
jgi:hypothetical protein